MQVWKILRPAYWRADRAIRNTHPLVVIVVILAVVAGVDRLWPRFVATLSQAVSVGDFSPLAWLPPVVFALVMVETLHLADIAYTLYLKSDNELLLTAPVSMTSYFMAKWLECSRLALLPGIVLGATTMALVDVLDLAAGYFLLAVLAAVLTVAGLTSLGLLMVMLIVGVIPMGRLRTWLPVMMTLMPAAMLVFQEPILANLHQLGFLAGLEAQAQTGAGTWLRGVAGLGLGAIVLSLLAARLFQRTYLRDWGRMLERPSAPHRRAARPRSYRRWPIPPPTRSILRKDWLELIRQPGQWVGLIIQPLLVVLMFLPLLKSGSDNPVAPLFFWLAVMMSFMFSLTTTISQSMSGLALEGRCMTLYKTAPIPPETMLTAKWLGSRWIAAVPLWSAMLMALSTYMDWPLGAAIIASAVMVLAMVLGSFVGVFMGARWANFWEEEPGRRLPLLATLVGLGLGVVLGGLSLFSTARLVFVNLPENNVTLPLAVVGQSAFGKWLLGPGSNATLWLVAIWLLLGLISWALSRSAVRRWAVLEA